MTAPAAISRRALATSAAVNWLGFATQMVVAFFLSPVLVHRLENERYGIWSLVESILAYLVLLDMGVAASVVRYVARFNELRDQDQVNRIFSTSLCIFAAAGAVAQVAAIAIAAFGMQVFKAVPPGLLSEARWLLVLLGINFGIGLPLSVFPCLLEGLGRYPARTGIRTVMLLVRSGVLLAVVLSGYGLIGLGVAITACTLTENLLMAAVAWRFMPALRFSIRAVTWETFRTIRGYTADAFVAMMAGRISFQTDAIVIGIFLRAEQITFFAIAGRLVEYAKESLRAMTTVLTPAFSVLDTRGDQAAIRRLFLDGTRYALWLILAVQAGLMTIGRPFIGRWMGAEYEAVSFPVLLILSAPLGLAMSQSVSARILYGTSRLRWYSRALMLEAAANLVLSVALVTPMGIAGVALGTAIPNVILNVILMIYMCRLLEVGLARYLRVSFAAPVLAATVLAAGWYAVAWNYSLATYPRIVFIGGAGLLLYGLAAWLYERGIVSTGRSSPMGKTGSAPIDIAIGPIDGPVAVPSTPAR